MALSALPVGRGGELDHDRLSELPDHILLCILERLRGDVRVLARTCVLSRRWRTLPVMLSALEININTFVVLTGGPSTLQRLHQATVMFTGAVRFFLATATAGDQPRAVRYLRLVFCLTTDEHLRDIGQLVDAAIGRGKVRDLELVIHTNKGRNFLRRAPKVASITRCFADRFMRLLGATPPAVFGSLRKLALHNLRFRDASDVGVLLRTCTALEILTLDYCGLSDQLSELAIDAPPQPKLKVLCFDECYIRRIHLVQVPKLVTLICSRWLSESCPVTFGPGSVPYLQEIILNNRAEEQLSFSLSELLENVNNVETLRLAFGNGRVWLEPENPKILGAAFSKLKMLNLMTVSPEGDLSWTMFLLQAAPLLQLVDIEVYSNDICMEPDDDKDMEELEWEVPPGFRHRHLRELRVYGDIDATKDVRFARLVMERAVNLERLVLDARITCEECVAAQRQDPSVLLSKFPKDKDDVDAMVRQLKDGISTSARIIVYPTSMRKFEY
ncbi:hypothetical protein ACP70R_048238 [Stipagrostis hirtigluma subsp. patula]